MWVCSGFFALCLLGIVMWIVFFKDKDGAKAEPLAT
jgi:hypothetical protein